MQKYASYIYTYPTVIIQRVFHTDCHREIDSDHWRFQHDWRRSSFSHAVRLSFDCHVSTAHRSSLAGCVEPALPRDYSVRGTAASRWSRGSSHRSPSIPLEIWLACTQVVRGITEGTRSCTSWKANWSYGAPRRQRRCTCSKYDESPAGLLHARHKDRVIRWSLPRYVWRSTCWSEQVGEHGRDASHAVRDTRASRGWPNRQERRRTRRDGLTSTEERRIRRGASRRVRTPLLPRAPTKPTLWRRHRRFATPLALPRFLPPPSSSSSASRLFFLLPCCVQLPSPLSPSPSSSFLVLHHPSFVLSTQLPSAGELQAPSVCESTRFRDLHLLFFSQKRKRKRKERREKRK